MATVVIILILNLETEPISLFSFLLLCALLPPTLSGGVIMVRWS